MPQLTKAERDPLNAEQIKYMANRFLGWKLPEDFSPDGGITFDRVINLGTEHQSYREPVGTNLLTATQAEAMVRHMIEGLPLSEKSVTADTHRGWVISWDYSNFTATGPNYDASYEGPEDGWVDNGHRVFASTREGLIEEIEAWFEERAA